MSDETKTEKVEAVENSESKDTAEKGGSEILSAQTSAAAKKEEIVEQVEQHEVKDPFAAIAELAQRLAKLEKRPATKVYLKSRKEKTDGVQAEEPTASEPPAKEHTAVKGRGKIRLWRTF